MLASSSRSLLASASASSTSPSLRRGVFMSAMALSTHPTALSAMNASATPATPATILTRRLASSSSHLLRSSSASSSPSSSLLALLVSSSPPPPWTIRASIHTNASAPSSVSASSCSHSSTTEHGRSHRRERRRHLQEHAAFFRSLALVLGLVSAAAAPAFAADAGLSGGNGGSSDGDGKSVTGNAQLDKLIDQYSPAATQVTFGGVCGFCSGYAVKKAGKLAALGVGVAFCALQALAYSGVVEVKWQALERATIRSLDQNGDGKLDATDAKLAIGRLQSLLQYGLPSSAGFGAGFALGLKLG